jgi:uncharacterized repeat protein (TIGR03803 family)
VAPANLYGTTLNGPYTGENLGTVFELSPSGQEAILYSFGYIPDGWSPNGGLVMDAQGNLYGTSRLGGAGSFCNPSTSTCEFAGGTVFKIAPNGTETLLHSFASPSSSRPPRTAGIPSRD